MFIDVLNTLKERKSRVESGLLNCIPFPFPRFRNWVPGIERAKYIVLTANQKVGKSKLADFMFVYEPLFYSIDHAELRFKVLYFTLEMSPEEKYLEFLCHLLYRLDKLEISPTALKSTARESPVPEYILKLLETERYQRYIRLFEEKVIYIDTDRNPTGIHKYCREYALSNGDLKYKKVQRKEKGSDLLIDLEVIDHYQPDDPEEYRIVIVDNASNLTMESGLKKMETIDKLSKYGIILRTQLKYIFVLIQHQAQSQEGIENFKLNKMKPSSDGLADCKTTTRDLIINTLRIFYINV